MPERLHSRHPRRGRHAVGVERNRHEQPREGTRRTDIEELRAIGDGTRHADDRAEGAERREDWKREEVRQAHGHAVHARGDVVAGLVRRENCQERTCHRERGRPRAVIGKGAREQVEERRRLAFRNGHRRRREGRHDHAQRGRQKEQHRNAHPGHRTVGLGLGPHVYLASSPPPSASTRPSRSSFSRCARRLMRANGRLAKGTSP